MNFCSFEDVKDLHALVTEALRAKADPLADQRLARGKTLGLVFANPSLRTRLSTQKAAMHLGLQALVANFDGEGWGLESDEGVVMNGKAGEHVKEAAAVLGEYCDIIGVRAFPSLTDRAEDERRDLVASFERFAGRPIINLENFAEHPLQALADIVTIVEHSQHLNRPPKVVLTWAPHIKALPHAVPHSFAAFLNMWQAELTIAHPPGYELDPRYVGTARVTNNQDEALRDADFVYAKNWSSLESYGQILSRDASWMITQQKMALTADAGFMHCLPVRRNLVVADAVLDGNRSLVRHQAGNRVWAAQAVLKALLVQS